MSTFANISVGLAMLRDLGVLKRVRMTPLPVLSFAAGRIGSALVTATLLTVVSLALGDLAFDADLRLATLPGLVLTLLLRRSPCRRSASPRCGSWGAATAPGS